MPRYICLPDSRRTYEFGHIHFACSQRVQNSKPFRVRQYPKSPGDQFKRIVCQVFVDHLTIKIYLRLAMDQLL